MSAPIQIETSNENKESTSDIKEQFGKIWVNIPLFLKCYYSITIILCILNIKIKIISFYMINIPYYTIFHFQLWRLLTSVFITTNFIQIIIAYFVWIKSASKLENLLGTIKYTFIFFLNAICIQIINTIFIFGSLLVTNKLYNPELKAKHNCGLWGMIMCEMTLLCLSNPESPIKLLLLPLTLKAKIYPFILLLIFLLSNFLELDVEITSGIIYGFIYYYYLKKKFQISDSFIQSVETSFILRGLGNIKGFVSVSHISNGLPVTITKEVSHIEVEQEKEKLKGKGVIVSGSLESNTKEEEQEHTSNDVTNNIVGTPK